MMVFLVGAFSLQAQFPAGGAGRNIPNMGHIYGKLEDSTGHPISEATVLFLHNKYDSVTKKVKTGFAERTDYQCKWRFQF